MVALPLLAVLAAAIGNTRWVHLGAEWYEPAVPWTCVVAESDSLKSPAADLTGDLVKARQRKLFRMYRDELDEYRRGMGEFRRRARG